MLMILDLLNFLFMMVATVGPLYIAFRVRKRSRRLFTLAVFLGSFTLIHGCYHLLQFLGVNFLANVVFYPLSAALLLCFGILYWKAGV
jgi:ABC-type Mn2+/Zn2+ transport system permease subunit